MMSSVIDAVNRDTLGSVTAVSSFIKAFVKKNDTLGNAYIAQCIVQTSAKNCFELFHGT